MSTTTPAPASLGAHQARLAATMRAGLGTEKPQPGRRVAAQLLAQVRTARGLTAYQRFDLAAHTAARVACVQLRAGDVASAVEHAYAEQLLLERAEREHLARIARIGWAA